MFLSSIAKTFAVSFFVSILHETSGWYLVMMLPQGREVSEAKSIVDLWNSTIAVDDPHREYAVNKMIYTQMTKPYKAALDNWYNRNVQRVRLSFYMKESEKAFIVFDATRASRTSWFAPDRIIDSSYPDLLTSNTKVCSITGTTNETRGRSFMILKNNNTDCLDTGAWTMLLDFNNEGRCFWEYVGMYPQFLFANSSRDMANSSVKAEIFAIYVDDCAGFPCQHGKTCTNLGNIHTCNCGDDYYGKNCEVPCPCENSGKCIRVSQRQIESQSIIIDFKNVYKDTIEVVPGLRAYCACGFGFSGSYCRTDIDDCEPNPCKHNGECIDGTDEFTCSCMVGYSGTNCSVDEGINQNAESGAIITVSIVVPIIVILIVAAAAWCVYIYRNPQGYGRKQTFRTVALVRDTIRRSFRRLSGRARQPRRQHDMTGFDRVDTETSQPQENSPYTVQKSPRVYEQDVHQDEDEGGFTQKKQNFHDISLDAGFEIPADWPPNSDKNGPIPAPRRQTGQRQTRNNQSQSEESPPPYENLGMHIHTNPIPSTSV